MDADRSQVDDQNSLDIGSTSLAAQQDLASGTDIAASVEAVQVLGDSAAWKVEWAGKVNALNSALDALERDRIGDSGDVNTVRSDERAQAVKNYSLAHNAQRKTRDDAVDAFWSDFALEHAALLDSVAGSSTDTTPWQDRLEAETSATLTQLSDEAAPRAVHSGNISLAEQTYADELAARRFDLQHDRNVQAKADALAAFDEQLADQEALTAADGYELDRLEYTAAPFEPAVDAETDFAAWDTGLQSERHWAIQGYERYPGFVPVELMENALTAGRQDEYGDFDFTSATWDSLTGDPQRYAFQLNPAAHLSEALDQDTWTTSQLGASTPWWQFSALATGSFARTPSGSVVSNFTGFASFGGPPAWHSTRLRPRMHSAQGRLVERLARRGWSFPSFAGLTTLCRWRPWKRLHDTGELTMKCFAGVSTVLVIAAALGLNAAFQDGDQVEVARLDGTSWDAFVPHGKEVDAIYGDYVLRNENLVAVIAQPLASRNANMTVRDVGGCLIDLTARQDQSDQLSAFYPGARAFPYRSSEVQDEKGNGIDLALGASSRGARRAIQVRSPGTATRPTVLVTYSLSVNAKHLDVTSRYVNESKSAMTVPLEDDMRIDSRNEDIIKAPNGTEKLYWVHDRHWGQAYGFEAPGFEIASDSNSRTSTLRYVSDAANRKVTLEPGKSFELKRRIFPAANLPDVRAIAAENAGEKTYPLQITYSDESDRPIAGARITLKRGDAVWGSMTAGPKGQVRTRVPKGEYTHSLEVLGLELGSDFKRPTIIDGEFDGSSLLGKVPGWNPGTVKAEITDAAGKPIPCKVEFFAKGSSKQFSWGPPSGDFRIGSLRYAPRGTFEEAIPPGEYEVVIAHGPEHDAIFTNLTVPAGKTVSLTGKLKRVVDTTGWISSDFHSHSSPSGDNTGSQLGRILNLAADHIEFAPCTEHNRIDSYQPHIDRLNIGEFMSTCSGMELTGSPLLLNHQNAFPLKLKPHLQDGGGPVTDTDVETQVERLSRWDDNAEKLLQINHPDFGWLFRDKNGDGEPDDGHPRILPHIDVVEIHPIPDILTLDPDVTASTYKGNNRIYNWLQMLNQGRRFVGVVNTDAHYNYHESGWLRNWLKSPTDDPAKVKPLDIVRAAEAGANIMSNGPFLEVSMREAGSQGSVIGGQDLEAKSGKVEIDVRVQCPNWLDIDRVFVLVNGRIDKKHHYRKATSPNLFRSGVVKFDEKLTLELEKDAHLIVVTGADGRTLGKVHGPTWGQHHPAAFHNPVFVDVDGNGFQPNGDTLDYPLPVKFGAKKE